MKIAIVGGGMYGLVMADAFDFAFKYDVTVYEKERDILLGASSKNFRRVHRGYHYPLSYETAKESKFSYDEFVAKYAAFCEPIETIYWLASDSKVGERQYKHFLNQIDLPFKQTKLKRPNTNFGIACEEAIYNVDLMRDYWNNNLNIVTNCRQEDYADADIVIDCTYVDSPLVESWQLKESTVLLISSFELPKMAQTVLYGPYCGLIPDGDKFRFYHAAETNPRKMMESGCEFFPELKRAVIHDVIKCTHAHPNSKTDSRPFQIQKINEGKIGVLSGKIAQSIECARQVAFRVKNLTFMSDEGATEERAKAS